MPPISLQESNHSFIHILQTTFTITFTFFTGNFHENSIQKNIQLNFFLENSIQKIIQLKKVQKKSIQKIIQFNKWGSTDIG